MVTPSSCRGLLTGNGHHMVQAIATIVEAQISNPLPILTPLEEILYVVLLAATMARRNHCAEPELVTEVMTQVLAELRQRGYVEPLAVWLQYLTPLSMRVTCGGSSVPSGIAMGFDEP